MAQLQVFFLWESDNRGFSPCGWPFLLSSRSSCRLRPGFIMASPPALSNSACMLSAPTDVPTLSAVSAASASSRRMGRGSSSGICWQSSIVDSPSVS